jgi:hypothetical protein
VLPIAVIGAVIGGGSIMSSMRDPEMPVIKRVPRWNVA